MSDYSFTHQETVPVSVIQAELSAYVDLDEDAFESFFPEYLGDNDDDTVNALFDAKEYDDMPF
jgi:hypothetical protein